MRLSYLNALCVLLLMPAINISQDDRSELQASISRVENGLLPPVLIKGDVGWNILDRLKFHNVPGVSIAVFDKGRVLWAKGYGVTDVDTKEPVTEKTLFVAGSVSKPVAVMGALRLVQEGILSLDENINKFLTSWKLPDNEFTRTEKVTLRRIMSHSAGVTVHGFLGYAEGEPIPSLTQILNGEKPANSLAIRVDLEPGKLWRYSGGGITIMQQAMIDISHKSFPEIMDEKVLSMLGMSSSSYNQALAGERLALAASGHRNGQVIKGKRHRYPEMAAAGLWTTPTDLAKFAMEVFQSVRGNSNKVLSPELARLMVNPQIKIAPGQEMALGLFLEHRGGATYFGHGGQDEGFICQLFADRDSGCGAVVMTNSDSRSGLLISEILRSIAREYRWHDYLPAPFEIVTLDDKKLSPYVGRFLRNSDDIVAVQKKDGRLLLTETGSSPLELLAVSDDEFVCRDVELRFTFGKVEQGRANELTGRSSGGDKKLTRVSDDVTVPLELLLAGKVEGAMLAYRALWKNNKADPVLAESRLNGLGYRFLGEGKNQEAITLFRLNTEFYPQSSNTYDSLGEGYMKNGDKQLAIKSYTKSLELDPKNNNAILMLQRLKGK